MNQDSTIMREPASTVCLGVALGILAVMPAAGARADGVIPLPAAVTPHSGTFTAGAATPVRIPAHDRGARQAAAYFVALLARTHALELRIVSAATVERAGAADQIVFQRRPAHGPEGYSLDVEPHRVTVSATTDAGLFYGAVTLWQLAPTTGAAVSFPAQSIEDGPAYRWRGLLLDSVRHFQSPRFIESMIDWMAWHKLNVLHWHLTDDQGWRLEIKKYPRLTQVGAWRVPAEVPGTVPDATDPGLASRRYGGFYTQAQVRRIVAFAASRHVLIVPEIDVPGHAQAAIAAYPALGVTDRPLAVSARWGVHSHLLNLEPSTFRFFDDVLREVVALFPGPYVHLGGDEPAEEEWQASAAVRTRARALGLRDTAALQAYFTQRLAKTLAKYRRRVIGWDEILRPGLRQDAIVMSWHGTAGAERAAASGHDAILAPWPTLYLDNRQSTLPNEPPGRLSVISLEDVYRFEPHDSTLKAGEQAHILGVQANIWTEHMSSEQRVQWMTLPRAAALAEIAWTPPERRSWPDFLGRLVPMFARYRAAGIQYADSVFAIEATPARSGDRVAVTLANQAGRGASPVGEIHYTLDGGEPTADSRVYRDPLSLPLGTELRAAAYVGAERVSAVWARRLDELSLRHEDSHTLDLCSKGIGLLLEPETTPGAPEPPIAIDIMNPCWIERAVDLSTGVQLRAAVAPLPFNYEIGGDADKIRVGDARSPDGELEIHVDACDTPAAATLPLQPAAQSARVTILPALRLPARAGRHDLCFRFARPRLDPMWALDWVELSE